jgi:hypothetical protein
MIVLRVKDSKACRIKMKKMRNRMIQKVMKMKKMKMTMRLRMMKNSLIRIKLKKLIK